MTTATISVSAVTGGGKTLLLDMIKQRLALVPGLIVQNEGEDVMVERMNVVYDVGYLSPNLNDFRDIVTRSRPWSTLPNGIFEYRDIRGNSLFMWADETENFAGFEDDAPTAVLSRERYAESLNQKPKPKAEESPHHWQLHTMKTDGRYSLVKVGKRVYAITETFPGQEDTPQLIHVCMHSHNAHIVFNALTRAYNAGGDNATALYINEAAACRMRAVADSRAIAVTVICGDGHIQTLEPAQDHAQATQAATPGKGTEKAGEGQGAPNPEAHAHITGPVSNDWAGSAWNPAVGSGAASRWQPVVSHTFPLWPDESVKVDVLYAYNKPKRERCAVLGTDVNWTDPNITHWRFSKGIPASFNE